MSTGLSCEFIEPKPGVWYYVLEDWSSPKGAWDWHDYATAYGPFRSEQLARDHLHDNHANPGGAMIIPHTNYHSRPVLEKLFAKART